ncbi:HNH endonuclease [Sphingomicrobium aestuariivivum]|uniref:HNH endonuclease n=1 Tax=Sphingomicrobium aestuariivivum TaxID=1582356 RepID=UPI001FD69343|nr:HNH endonuclease [Sphingomicrobium aestuariivivum]MCJ8191379.1 HNH endonuclease [Sphingomicrobium aestuariivivum]
MPRMTTEQLTAFGAENGAISKITVREATRDRSVTLDRFEKSVLFTRYHEGSFARRGGAAPDGKSEYKNFLVNPHLVGNPSLESLRILLPKQTGSELRLYGTNSIIDLKADELFYIFTRKGEPNPFVGTITPSSLATLRNAKRADVVNDKERYVFDDESEDATFQQAIEDAAAKKPVKFSGERYPRDPKIALAAIRQAGFRCEAEVDGERHATFTSAVSGEPFVEAHHLVPLSTQASHDPTLDSQANIVALCPTCHRKLHHAATHERLELLLRLFGARSAKLQALGLKITQADLVEAYGIDTAELLRLLDNASG